jgi:hypothetical protein
MIRGSQMRRRPWQEQIAGVKPEYVAAYLRGTGWQWEDAMGGKASVWTRTTDAECRPLLLPKHSEFADYGARLLDLVEALAAAEERPESQIAADLLLVDTDVVRVRLGPPVARAGSVPLLGAIDLVAGMKGVIEASACAVEEPRPAYPSRRSRRVSEYMQATRFGQTSIGSFVASVLCPLRTPESAGEARSELLPFGREVTEKVSRSVAEARRAAEVAVLEDDLSPFEDAVAEGVSAELCQALARIGRGRRGMHGLTLSVAWSPQLESDPALRTSMQLEPAHCEVLPDAAELLRRARCPDGDELMGWVQRLERSEPDESGGKVTVEAQVDGKRRKVQMALPPDEYEEAVEAHRRGGVVHCSVVLSKCGRALRLDDVQGFRAIPPDS